jgi:hypothetical protein
VTAHELARILLDGPDGPVIVEHDDQFGEPATVQAYTLGSATTVYVICE